MKIKIKKLLAMVMCLVVVSGVCAAGVACDPNKETEAEYKARIKKELDEIPVEATGYKLINLLSDVPPYDYKVVVCGGITYENIFDNRMSISVCEKNGTTDEDYGFYISVDSGEGKWISFNYDPKYKFFGHVNTLVYLDEKLFIIRRKRQVGGVSELSDYFPATLFLYDYETNSLKYMGYHKEWFDESIYDANYRSVAVTRNF